MRTVDSPDTAFRVRLEYVEPDDPSCRVKDVDFVVARTEVRQRIHEVTLSLNMDAENRDRMLGKVDRAESYYHGFLFLETNPSRRVALYIHRQM